MGVALYVCSTQNFSGKSALCTGLAQQLVQDGLAPAYMKPISIIERRVDDETTDPDAAFVAEVLGLRDAPDVIAPICLSPQAVDLVLRSKVQPDQYLRQLQVAFQQVSAGRQVVLLEGARSLSEGGLIDLSPAQIVSMLNARALVVVKYDGDLQAVDEALLAERVLGASLLGVVFNVVPYQQKQFVSDVVVPALNARRIQVYGILPQEHLLTAVSVGEVANVLGGEILCARDHRDELVENLMVGAMNPDAALSYFRRKPNKAVVTGGDRLDIQLAALETSTRCLILTGNLYPSSVILSRAEEVGVPVVLVRQDTLTAVELIERYRGKTRFHQAKKVDIFNRVLARHFSFTNLYRDLGLAQSVSSTGKGSKD
jgi:uncharacterized protein